MDVLFYNELEVSRVRKQVDKVVDMLKRDDFFSADVKKLVGTPYYRAKLDHTNRLLFKIVRYEERKVALLLEVIHQHAYEKSRFLKGALVDEDKYPVIQSQEAFDQEKAPILTYVNPHNAQFHLLDKIISLDMTQEAIFALNPPLIIIGSAGSGKTMLTLEKMKTCPGDVLYVTGSSYLVQNARELYYAESYTNECQTIDFLSYRELVETYHIPEGKEIDFPRFVQWLSPSRYLREANKLYEEFKGVITGNTLETPFLNRAQYLQLGIKQSIYPVEERHRVYDLFEKYLTFLKDANYYDINLISYGYLSKIQPKYDCVVVDEVQDFTPVQLTLILKTLKFPQQFILCGDSNQIVHPNFFSWAKIKSLFYQASHDYSGADLIRLLTKNYRNAPNVTAIANTVLKSKHARFGSIDKESHYLVESQSTTPGEVYCLLDSDAICGEINEKTRKSTRFAVIVLRDDLKEKASQRFQTPLVFSIYEAKGLEYDNVILYHFVTSDEKNFRDITQGVRSEDLQEALTYSRVKDKTDRSLEIYKFFINALYVAITRAIKNVYFIESIERHPLFDLLNLHPSTEFVAIENQESSLEDWQKEARRLEMQGKQEQAAAIRESILKTQSVPWTVMTPERIAAIRDQALDLHKKDKEARLLLFEYAMQYHQVAYITELAGVSFAPALRPKRDYDLLEKKYFFGYSSSNTTLVMRHVDQYGVDYRTEFNQTPLMTASYLGNALLVKQLISKGANPDLLDNLGRNAFQVALQHAFLDKRFAREKLAPLYESLLSSDLSLQIDDKLIKLDTRRIEFLLVNAMMILMHQKDARYLRRWCLQVDDFLDVFEHFPNNILPEKRKQRAYLSSILAKHEIHREHIYNKRLFLRVMRGYYILNPACQLKMNDGWINVYAMLGLESVKERILAERVAINTMMEA